MWKKREFNKTTESKLLEKGADRLIARLLSQRDIFPEQLEQFIKKDYSGLSHPHTLHGIKEGVDIFCKVAKAKGDIFVFGDYDVDGIMSSVIMNGICSNLNVPCEIFVPSRFEHGYGLNEKSIDAFKEARKSNVPELVFCVDCGINNDHEIQQLKDFGVKYVIIIDHHLISDEPPKNADVVISWLLSDDPYEMCAAAECFQFARGLRWVTKKIDPI